MFSICLGHYARFDMAVGLYSVYHETHLNTTV